MTSRRQLRDQLDYMTACRDRQVDTIENAWAARNRALADLILANAELAESRAATFTAQAEVAARDLMIAERDDKLTYTATRLTAAERHACEIGLSLHDARERVTALVEDLRIANERGDAWREETRGVVEAMAELADVASLMERIGDRMAANAPAITAKEWAAAKNGRSLRGPDGRILKEAV